MQTTSRTRIPASQVQSKQPTFRTWYEKTFNRALPIYLRSEMKKELVARFENETRLISLS